MYKPLNILFKNFLAFSKDFAVVFMKENYANCIQSDQNN